MSKNQPKISLRYQQVKDGKVIYAMMTHPDSPYYANRPANAKMCTNDIRRNLRDKEKDGEYTYSILLAGTMIGSISLRVDTKNPAMGEFALMIHHDYHNCGYATQALQEFEKLAAAEYEIKQAKILTQTFNKPMQQLAQKCGYQLEKTIPKAFWNGEEQVDGILYTKKLITELACRQRPQSQT